jgi:hypothetical protein
MKDELFIPKDLKEYLLDQNVEIDPYDNGVIRIRTDQDYWVAITISKLLDHNPGFYVSGFSLIPGKLSHEGLIGIRGAIVVFSRKARVPISDFKCGPSRI